MSDEQDIDPRLLDEFRRLLEQDEKNRVANRLVHYTDHPYDHGQPFGPMNTGPYKWQTDFYAAGAHYPERCLMAGNRTGKTMSGAIEACIHLTGLYPSWWTGRRWDRPVEMWIGSDTNETSRDIVQKTVLGDPHGTGWLPPDTIIKSSTRQCGITNVVDTLWVKHVSGGASRVTFKAYEQGRKKWQGTSMDYIWLDEEPPFDVFTEALTRLIDKKGAMVLTFTPMNGVGETVLHFTDGGKGIYMISATWDDAPHLDADEKHRLLMSFPAHERKARTQGVPMLGSGGIYTMPDDMLMCDPFEIPRYFKRICGIDFGIDHPFAAVWIAWDVTADVIYITDCYATPGETPAYHAEAINKRGKWIPVSWPHDGMHREKSSGRNLADQMREDHGMKQLLGMSARYLDDKAGPQDTEPVILECDERMRTGRLKVFRHLDLWFREKRMYHRKDGKIIRKQDDIMSAMHTAVMMKRFARNEIFAPPAPVNAAGYDPLAYA